MALPDSLRVSITPAELELIACQQLIEIVPLISMERTAFISVLLYLTRPNTQNSRLPGRVWTSAAAPESHCTNMDGS